MIGHLNWQSLADRRTDARLVILFMRVAIPKTHILILPVRFSQNMHSLSYQILPTCLQFRQQSFFYKQYETGTVYPWTMWRAIVLSHSNQLFHSLTISSSLTHVYCFILGTDHLTWRGGVMVFVSFKKIFSDNTRVRIFIFVVAQSAIFFFRVPH
jgi:hypothetical protein